MEGSILYRAQRRFRTEEPWASEVAMAWALAKRPYIEVLGSDPNLGTMKQMGGPALCIIGIRGAVPNAGSLAMGEGEGLRLFGSKVPAPFRGAIGLECEPVVALASLAYAPATIRGALRAREMRRARTPTAARGARALPY
jgi:hypothetical protein